MTRILGVDPGLTGAVAVYDKATRNLQVFDLPTLTVPHGKGNKTKTTLNLPAVLDLFSLLQADHAYMEDVHSMPGQGIVSTSRFMRAAGQIDMALCASSVPLSYVSPVVWKKRLQIRGDKDASIERALQLFPKSQHLFTLKKHHNRADAALIAFFGGLVENTA